MTRSHYTGPAADLAPCGRAVARDAQVRTGFDKEFS